MYCTMLLIERVYIYVCTYQHIFTILLCYGGRHMVFSAISAILFRATKLHAQCNKKNKSRAISGQPLLSFVVSANYYFRPIYEVFGFKSFSFFSHFQYLGHAVSCNSAKEHDSPCYFWLE
jgi:hypothetical protein